MRFKGFWHSYQYPTFDVVVPAELEEQILQLITYSPKWYLSDPSAKASEYPLAGPVFWQVGDLLGIPNKDLDLGMKFWIEDIDTQKHQTDYRIPIKL